MMKNRDFAVFILTHGRPNNVITYKSLQKHGYTGKVFIVIDNEDKSADQYREIFGDKVVVFDKAEIAKTFDEGDNFQDRRAIIYARNATFQIADEKGIKYFMQLDDDYTDFRFKFNANDEYGDWSMKRLDVVLDVMLNFYKSTPALSVAMAQGGDFVGGVVGNFAEKKLRRKCMNTFICSTDRVFQFFGRINEDVNTYTNLGGRGGLFLTVPNIAIQQKQTQSNAGGMTDLYLDSGTYVKSFYSVMYSPSCVDIRLMGSKHRRLHHRISWATAVPVILDEKFKK
ncbi:hypothetical protein [Prosthecochloris sp.]|uniref:GREB1-related protein n=1 Tax=Prosthecochloris sp. TaxID=290513 RepID=UPI0025D9C8C5|nr:hypothetical protein [Prosthecochloris sp.]